MPCSPSGHLARISTYRSSTSRIFRPRVSEVNGLCRNAIPGSRTPWWTMASSRVPGHVDHLQRGPPLDQPPGQLRSAGARHHDVGQEHVDGRVPLEQLEALHRRSRRPARCSLGARSSLLASSRSSVLILNHEHRLPSPHAAARHRRRRVDDHLRGIRPREIHHERRAPADFAVDVDAPAAPRDDAVRRSPGQAPCLCRAPWS